MFGLIVKFTAYPGQRKEFVRIMSAGFCDMPGCHSYILAEDVLDDISVWVTEIWNSSEDHDVAVASPRIKAIIDQAKPLMASRELRVVTRPMGGQGL